MFRRAQLIAPSEDFGERSLSGGGEDIQAEKMHGLHHRILFRLIEAAQPVSVSTCSCLGTKPSGLPWECEANGEAHLLLFVFFMCMWSRYKQVNIYIYPQKTLNFFKGIDTLSPPRLLFSPWCSLITLLD